MSIYKYVLLLFKILDIIERRTNLEETYSRRCVLTAKRYWSHWHNQGSYKLVVYRFHNTIKVTHSLQSLERGGDRGILLLFFVFLFLFLLLTACSQFPNNPDFSKPSFGPINNREPKQVRRNLPSFLYSVILLKRNFKTCKVKNDQPTVHDDVF